MRNIITFIIRYHFLLLFVVLEIIAFTFLVNSTYYQRSAILGTGNAISGRFYHSVSSITDYLHLKQANEDLVIENSILRKVANTSFLKNDTNSFWVEDTIYRQQYNYIVARVIHNTVGKRNNFIMLDKGSKSGIKKDMGVITSDGVVGTVVSVSDHFAWVMSLLNKHSRISARITSNDQVGTVLWNGIDHNLGTLTDIPAHVKIAKGDTIVTSGFSYVFPSGVMMGTIEDFRVEQGDHFYTIPFKFSVDFNSLQHVYVVMNLLKDEQQELEQSTKAMNDE